MVRRATRGASAPAASWVLAGLVMLVSDWIVNDEDQLFHLIVSVVTGGLAAGAWSIGRCSRRGR